MVNKEGSTILNLITRKWVFCTREGARGGGLKLCVILMTCINIQTTYFCCIKGPSATESDNFSVLPRLVMIFVKEFSQITNH